MKWPKGKYNGRRIVGFYIKFRFDVLYWAFHRRAPYGGCLSLGPFHIWFGFAYEEWF